MRCHEWVNEAVGKIEADFQRSADTHLIKLDLPSLVGVDVYLKDESTHPTGSLKHRLARSLFLYALCNGWVNKGTTVIESSSGSTAVSEAYFARLLGLPFIAVMPRSTSIRKIRQIEFCGGQCHLVNCSSEIYAESHRLAKELNGHYMDQFTYAERATDWRGNNNIADSMFRQMKAEPHPVPSWVVMSPGTGGTSATIGRYIRYQKLNCKLCVVDPDNSVFMDYYQSGDSSLTIDQGSRIEGIGRSRVEPSFIPGVIDGMRRIPDAAAIATIHWLETILGRKAGPSTGTNLYGVLQIASEMTSRGETGSVVTLLCD
ncbi:MAG: PLP-dependent cysteine synthase family protein, partial [Endozoicomonas sp.]